MMAVWPLTKNRLEIYRGTRFLVKRQTTTCSHFISPVLAVPLGPLVKNGCTTRRTRWQEWIINLRQKTCDGWILQKPPKTSLKPQNSGMED
ncbi:hypothetical protein PAMP_011259 [Pampus punctatissimus]